MSATNNGLDESVGSSTGLPTVSPRSPEQTSHAPTSSRSVRLLLAILPPSILVVPGIIFAFRPLYCQDPFWHVKAGEAMVRTHQVLKHDVFSHTAPGAHWTSLEWLSEVAMYCIHGALGFKGLRLMSALGFGAILVGVYRLLLRASGNKWWALIGTMIPYHFFLARMTGRPEVLGTVGLGSMHRV